MQPNNTQLPQPGVGTNVSGATPGLEKVVANVTSPTPQQGNSQAALARLQEIQLRPAEPEKKPGLLEKLKGLVGKKGAGGNGAGGAGGQNVPGGANGAGGAGGQGGANNLNGAKPEKKKIDLSGEITFAQVKQMLDEFIKKHKKERTAETTGNYEINLVPDIKGEMIRAIKLRNLVFFICLVLSAAAVGGVGMLWSVVGGQNLVMANQDTMLKLMSEKLNSYSSLSEFITIQDQMSKIDTINENRKILSRVFTVMDAMRPKGADAVSYSEVRVAMDSSTLTFDAQADAGEEPLIDYRVLESYKKNSQQMKYDYGRYVTAKGDEIPTRCIQEADENGNAYIRNGRYYAVWTRGVEGCDPSAVAEEDEYDEEVDEETESGASAGGTNAGSGVLSGVLGNGSGDTNSNGLISNDNILNTPALEVGVTEEEAEVDAEVDVYALNEEIYRTPVIAAGGGEWYEKGYIDESGAIDGVAHFESECIEYSATGEGASLRWTATNECMLSEEGVQVTSSSNGKNSGSALVLRFEATIGLDEKVLNFNNKHMMIISPTSRNVTDSYVQVEGMFAERAADCGEGDDSCDDLENSGGAEGSSASGSGAESSSSGSSGSGNSGNSGSGNSSGSSGNSRTMVYTNDEGVTTEVPVFQAVPVGN